MLQFNRTLKIGHFVGIITVKLDISEQQALQVLGGDTSADIYRSVTQLTRRQEDVKIGGETYISVTRESEHRYDGDWVLALRTQSVGFEIEMVDIGKYDIIELA